MSIFTKLLVLLGLFCSSNAYSQNWLWAKTSPMTTNNGLTEGYNMARDPAGNIYITGSYSSGSIIFGNDTFDGGASNFVIAKYDTAGSLIWVKESVGVYSAAFGLSCDPDGNVFVAGYFQFDTMAFAGHTITHSQINLRDYFLIKMDSAGNVQWSKNGGGMNAGLSWPVRADNAGNVYFFGSYISDSIKFDTYTLHNTGATNSRDLFLVKYDAAGNVLWAKNGGGPGELLPSNMTLDDLGNIYISGWMYGNKAYFDTDTVSKMTADVTKYNAFLAKYDATGNVLWARLAGGGNTNVNPYALKTDVANNVYVGGYMDTGTAIIGNTSLYNTPGSAYDGFFAKFSASGDPVWTKHLPAIGNNISQVFCIAREPISERMWLSGGFSGAFILAGTDTIFKPVLSHISDASYVIEYDTAGNVHCSTSLSGGGDDINFMEFDDKGYMYFGGDYMSDTFVVGNDSAFLMGTENLFVAKFEQCTMPVPNVVSSVVGNNDVTLFPNPAKEQFVISCNNTGNDASMLMYNVAGQLVKTVKLTGNNTTVSTASLPGGLYTCKVYVNGKVSVQKMVIE